MAIPAVPFPQSTHVEASTTVRTPAGRRELIVRWDDHDTPRADVRALLASLAEADARGEQFAPGDVVRVGWMPLRVADEGRTLTLLEPDLTRTPLRYVAAVDASLAHLRRQIELVDRVGLVPMHPSIDQHARVCSEHDGLGFVLDRSDPRGNDSGWIVGCDAECDGLDAHALVERPLHEIVFRWPFLVDFLALPPGSTVARSPRGDVAVHGDGRELAIRVPRESAPRPLARCAV